MAMLQYKKPVPRTQHESVAWVPQVLDTLATTESGIWASQAAASFLTRKAPVLDVRYQAPWKSATGEFNIPGQLDPTIAAWSPAFAEQTASFLTARKPVMNPIMSESVGWLDASLSLVDPTQTKTFGSGRSVTMYTKVFPRINFEDISWVTPQAIAAIPSRAGIFQSQAASYRTPDRPVQDVRLIQSMQAVEYVQSFLDANVGASVAQYAPPVLSQNASFMTRAMPVLEPRYQQLKERKFGIPFNPALLQGALTQSTMAASYRTPDVNRLMGPYSTWSPDAGIFQFPLTLPVQQRSAVMAQLAASYQTPARALLDVRTSPSHPTTGWEIYNLDPLLRIWHPAFAQLLNSFRSPDRAVLDPRGIYYDEFGWLDSALSLIDPPKKKLSDHRLTIMGAGR